MTTAKPKSKKEFVASNVRHFVTGLLATVGTVIAIKYGEDVLGYAVVVTGVFSPVAARWMYVKDPAFGKTNQE